MFSKKSIKMTGIALASLMTFGFVGTTASITEASSLDRGYEVQELASHRSHRSNDRDRYDEHRNPPPKHEKHEKQTSKKKYSEGERNTAAILGAVVGAIIAKNT